LTLADIELHLLAHVVGYDPSVESRVRVFGLTPGAAVRVLRRGWFRGAVLIEVNGRTLALGRTVAEKVKVEPDLSATAAPNGPRQPALPGQMPGE
jgi:Fe2+ transport system protein FeoA